ncbi:MAG: carboxymuconolactone decarboxylase family protein [Planctomycetes bacterium]|nr:carboxymuconolactone decarboxylase family protein [Planctomycetota bacterium]MBT6451420.1 carboxymuconolactone decarboxylase family protein [Planctomycetota bacterium]MBT6540828.1 carboxymuconolactone decarboxylase family protein [Planctomycetota bacterium]MBT6968311.1 carboxymuconolactone decarboxylase family protein [Planctomycetota bacterium]MBT7104146.1 carboxymuconolactone decarboxylase family protein [Planctomycetota bacterium]
MGSTTLDVASIADYSSYMKNLSCCHLSFALAAPERLAVETALSQSLQQHTAEEVEETILQSIPYSGFPAAVEALGWLRERFPTASSQRPTSSARTTGLFDSVYGTARERVLESLRKRHPDLETWIEQFAYRTVMDSSWLDAAQIESLAVASLIGQGRMSPLHSHLRGALRTGVKASELKELLDSLEPLAHPEVLEASRELLRQLTLKDQPDH